MTSPVAASRSAWRRMRGFVHAVPLLLLVPQLLAGEPLHTFWEVQGRHNTVWLLGSVHVLNDPDRALPEVATAAFADAETVVEELDLSAATADMLGGASVALETLPQGRTLAGELGPELYAHLQQEARTLGLDLDFMSRQQPWFVAMQVEQVRLLRAGYSPLNGVDFQIAQQAASAHKPLIGLETAADQLSLFAKLSPDEQREFLRATLDEEDPAKQLQQVTDAWRHGDVAALGELLRQGTLESPVFFKALTTDRNLRWLPQIEKMLQDPGHDYLVVTGALHMVGDDGLVSLLRKKGYRVEQK